ncbi:hypothetical protein [Streptomyces cinereoruber]
MSLPQIARILHWQHRRGPAHTLLRAVYDPATRQAVVVFSELASNPDDRGITNDFAPLAEAALPVLRKELSPDLASVLWIAHFGDFSYHYVPGPDSFTLITLEVTEHGYRDGENDRKLTADEVTRLFHGLPLAPVPEVLAGLEPST